MAAYVVVEIDVTDPETYQRYKAMPPPSKALRHSSASTELILVEGVSGMSEGVSRNG